MKHLKITIGENTQQAIVRSYPDSLCERILEKNPFKLRYQKQPVQLNVEVVNHDKAIYLRKTTKGLPKENAIVKQILKKI